MRAHLNNADIAHRGCWALASLACLSAGQHAAIDAGAPETIVAVLHAHATVADVVHYGLRALSSIAVLPSGRQLAVDARAPEAIVAAMCTHAAVADVAQYGCWALANISILPAGQQAVVDARAPAAIVSALQVHVETESVAQWGCYALEDLTSVAAGARAAVDAGAPTAVAAVMNAHPSLYYSARDVLSQLFRWACETGQLAVVTSIVESAGNADAGPMIAAEGNFALRLSARNGHLAVVIFLHENGADIHAGGNYAARWAHRNGHQAVVDYLLAHGAELTLSELVLDGVTPEELAARLKSCKECWIARPQRLNCPRGPGAAPSHNEPHECGICMRYPDCCEAGVSDSPHYEGNTCEECRPFWEKEWVAFRCGHMCHLKCAMGWAASKTHAARADDNLAGAPSVDCPHGRCVEIVRLHQTAGDEPFPDGLVRVRSVAPSASGGGAT